MGFRLAASATGVVKPRPVQATSIPGLLEIFQNEWDTLMLEAFAVKQQLETVRQELASSLYQQDAAARVIARLIKERDEARSYVGDTKERCASDAVWSDGGAAVCPCV